MITLRNGTTWTQRAGRLTTDALLIEPGATLRNEAEVYTYTTISEGRILGKGTLWAHVSSKYVDGEIDPLHTVIYYGIWPLDRRYIQIQTVSYAVATSSGHGSVIS